MELRIERTIDEPFRLVEAALLEGPACWLPGLREADGGATAELSVRLGASRLARRVAVQVGAVERPAPGRCRLPVAWRAVEHPERYPTLAGRLDLAEIGPRTELVLHATYDPPAGFAGDLADHLLMHRFAEASVLAFVQRIAGVLQRAAMSRGLAGAGAGSGAAREV